MRTFWPILSVLDTAGRAGNIAFPYEKPHRPRMKSLALSRRHVFVDPTQKADFPSIWQHRRRITRRTLRRHGNARRVTPPVKPGYRRNSRWPQTKGGTRSGEETTQRIFPRGVNSSPWSGRRPAGPYPRCLEENGLSHPEPQFGNRARLTAN